MPQVPLDRLDRDEERIRDFLVREPLRRQLGDLALALGQRLQAAQGGAPGAGTGGGELLPPPLDERGRSAALRQIDAAPQRIAGVAALACAAPARPEVDQGPCVVQGGLRSLEQGYGLLQQLEA